MRDRLISMMISKELLNKVNKPVSTNLYQLLVNGVNKYEANRNTRRQKNV